MLERNFILELGSNGKEIYRNNNVRRQIRKLMFLIVTKQRIFEETRKKRETH
jgi:hypothetical protein